MTAGISISDLHKSVTDFCNKHSNSFLAQYLPKTFGYGIGLKPKEDLLSLSANSNRILKPGMVFAIRLSLANFDSQKRPSRNCLQIADTVLVVGDGPPEVLTRATSRIYNDISYTLNDDEEELQEATEDGTRGDSGRKRVKEKGD